MVADLLTVAVDQQEVASCSPERESNLDDGFLPFGELTAVLDMDLTDSTTSYQQQPCRELSMTPSQPQTGFSVSICPFHPAMFDSYVLLSNGLSASDIVRWTNVGLPGFLAASVPCLPVLSSLEARSLGHSLEHCFLISTITDLTPAMIIPVSRLARIGLH